MRKITIAAVVLLAGCGGPERTENGNERGVMPESESSAYAPGWSPSVEESLTLENWSKIQEQLAVEGFDPGSADGVFGESTRKAISDWQRARGDIATGDLTMQQADALLDGWHVWGRFLFGGHYEGETRAGMPHGQGILTMPDGTRYTGAFRDGVPHGRGVFTGRVQSRGSDAGTFCYAGEYRDGTFYGGEYKVTDGPNVSTFPECSGEYGSQPDG